MPRLSEFYGIIIAIYYNDHAPPHFHARYGEEEATFRLDTLEIVEGALPRRALALVLEWASQHRSELSKSWDRARAGEPLDRIAPLD